MEAIGAYPAPALGILGLRGKSCFQIFLISLGFLNWGLKAYPAGACRVLGLGGRVLCERIRKGQEAAVALHTVEIVVGDRLLAGGLRARRDVDHDHSPIRKKTRVLYRIQIQLH